MDDPRFRPHSFRRETYVQHDRTTANFQLIDLQLRADVGDQVVQFLYNLASEMGVGGGQATPIPAVATAWQRHKHHTRLLASQLQDIAVGFHDLANHMSVAPSHDFNQTLMDIKQTWTDTHQTAAAYRQKCQSYKRRSKRANNHVKGLERRLRVQREELHRAQQRVKDLEALLQTVLQRETEPRISSPSAPDFAHSDEMSVTEGDDPSPSVSLSSPVENISEAADLQALAEGTYPTVMDSARSLDEEHQLDTSAVLLNFVSPPTPLASETAGVDAYHFQQPRPLEHSYPQEFLGQDCESVLPPISRTGLTSGKSQTASLCTNIDSSILEPSTPSDSAGTLDQEPQPSSSPVLLYFISLPTPPDSEATSADHLFQQPRPFGDSSPQEFLGQDREYVLPPISQTGPTAGGFQTASLSADLDISILEPTTPRDSVETLDEEPQSSSSPTLLNFISPTLPDSDHSQQPQLSENPSPQEFLGQDREYILPPTDPAGLAPVFRSASDSQLIPSQESTPSAAQTESGANRSSDQNTPPTSANSSSLNSSSTSESSTSSPGVQAWTSVTALTSIHQVMQSVSPPRCNNMVRDKKDLALWTPSSTAGDIELGRGSNGAVYLFRHARTQDPIALKRFPLSRDPNYRRRQLFNMREEASIQKDLGAHRHFPRYFGYVPLDGHTLALAMEFVGDSRQGRSTTLSEALYSRSSAWHQRDAYRIAFDVADGIRVMHREGYLINDLKSNNVLLSSELGLLRGKVIDFGHATRRNSPCRVYRLSSDEKQRYRTRGLYNHIAPEVALDGQYPSVRSDTYQVGKILVEMGLHLQLDALQNIGQECCNINPQKRPNLEYIVAVLEAIESSAH